jgi:hypothetical protein
MSPETTGPYLEGGQMGLSYSESIREKYLSKA